MVVNEMFMFGVDGKTISNNFGVCKRGRVKREHHCTIVKESRTSRTHGTCSAFAMLLYWVHARNRQFSLLSAENTKNNYKNVIIFLGWIQ